MSPYPVPKTSIEDIDGKKVLVIWFPGAYGRFRVRHTEASRYRNLRLSDFLKDLTEGKSTGITTGRAKLKSNGSPAAIYEFDEERTYFSATVKIHPEFLKQQSDTYDIQKS